MPDFTAPKLIMDQHSLRLSPYSKDATNNSLPGQTAETANAVLSNGVGGADNKSVLDSAVEDNELTPDEVATLKQAADSGDQESQRFLEQLGLIDFEGAAAATLGGTVGGAGAYYGGRKGLSLAEAYIKAKGGLFTDPAGQNSSINPATVQTKPQQMLALPAPTQQITDTRATRFNQSNVQEPVAIEDQRPFYEKSGGKLPVAQDANKLMKLREMMKRVRRVR